MFRLRRIGPQRKRCGSGRYDSRDRYLGERGTRERFEKYKKILAEWVAKRDGPLDVLSYDDPVRRRPVNSGSSLKRRVSQAATRINV